MKKRTHKKTAIKQTRQGKTASQSPQSSPLRSRLLVAASCYAIVIAAIVFYMTRAPLYSSQYTIMLPGSGSSSSFNLNGVGQVSQATRTPFGSAEFSPLVNYKQILRSRDVRMAAAGKLNLDVADIPVPRVEIGERSSILSISTESGSADLSQEISWAIHSAFREKLAKLRLDEVYNRDGSIEAVLNQYREKVSKSSKAIVDFQQRSLLVSDVQLNQLMSVQGSVREKKIELSARYQNVESFVRQLSLDLGISPGMAGRIFRLQSDPEFRGYLNELNVSAEQVSEFSSRWGKHHPKVVSQTLRYTAARTALRKRSVALVGAQAIDVVETSDLQSSPQRADLFAKLVDSYAKQQGIEAELNELSRMEANLNDQVKVFSRENAELERLQREHNLAEAVFTSAAAKLEAGKSDLFGSYPAVQLLSTPSVSNTPKNRNIKIALALGVLGFIFVTFGLLTIWHRDYLIRLVLKND